MSQLLVIIIVVVLFVSLSIYLAWYNSPKQKGRRGEAYIHNVLMLTNVVRSLIPDIVGNAKLYIVGSTIEQFSIAIAETMAKGVPFISTNVGNARLLPGGITVQSIGEMHKYMVSLTNDSIAYNLLSKNGKEYVLNNCVREFVIKNLESIIESI